MRVAVHVIAGHGRARLTCHAMADGIKACGDKVELRSETEHSHTDCDAAVFWGYIEPCQRIMHDYRAAGKAAVYIDMGYWQRAGQDGHFKVSVNDRHPTKYFQRIAHDDSRVKALGLQLKPWRKQGRHILLAGMSPKAAWAEKCEPVETFERICIKALRNMTDREIIYRPKPSWDGARPIDGTRYSPREQRLDDVLAGCHAVVTHHSNVAVDGLLAGIPAFVWHGVAVPMGSNDLRQIETPRCPDERQQWLNDVSYTQWRISEMREGAPWRHFKDEGLVS